MRPILGPDELEDKVREGRREAEAAFGNGEGYLEKMILRARHVEVQILGDNHGHIYHLYERDCSVQRRNQKVVERAPAPYLSPAQREEICGLGRKIAEAVHYECAGTVEFLMDMDTGQLLLHRGEPPGAGRAYRDRGGHRHRHRPGADQDRRGQVADGGDRHRQPVRRAPCTAMPSSAGSPPRIRPTTSSPTTAASPPIARPPAWASGLTAARPTPAR